MQKCEPINLTTKVYHAQRMASQLQIPWDNELYTVQYAVAQARLGCLEEVYKQNHTPIQGRETVDILIRVTREALPDEATGGRTNISLPDHKHELVTYEAPIWNLSQLP